MFYLAHEKKDFDIKDLVIVSLIAGLVLPCKMVYFPMLLLLFSIPLYKFKFRGKVDGKIKKENIAFFLVICGSGAIVMGICNVSGKQSYSGGIFHKHYIKS